MNREAHPLPRLPDFLATGCILTITFAELLMREQFHRASLETVLMLQLGTLAIVLAVLGRLTGGLRDLPSRAALASRFTVIAAAGASWSVLEAHALIPFPDTMRWTTPFFGVVVFLLLTWLLCVKASTSFWLTFRSAVCVGFLMFVASQWVIVAFRATTVIWPAWKQPAVTVGRSAQIFLLLDELNASAAGPIEDAIRLRGVAFRSKDLTAVADSTAKVIPSMFAGGDFEEAKPCGRTSICGRSDIVDFSKIIASRPDIDVVGFYMPYCAIRLLRSCQRLSVSSPLLDWRRWVCAGLRRLHYSPSVAVDTCAKSHSNAWGLLIDDVDAAIWRAPVWTRGGLLFAHVPLPHPPGRLYESPLKIDYADAVQRAAALTDKMLAKLEREGIDDFTLIVFSDHPLRTKLWCGSLTYADHPCLPTDDLDDHHVPLIVAGRGLPSIQAITSNQDIFKLQASTSAR